jgi:biotin carboxylase
MKPARRLAYVYHPHAFGVMEIAEAADGLCDIVWIVDRTVPEASTMARLMRRLGAVVDVTDLGPEEAAAQIAEHRPDGILALADVVLSWTADVAERLGLPFATPEAARRLADKHAQRTALRDAGLLTPGFWPVPAPGDEDGWARLARDAVFPGVLKPRRSASSRNTVPVASLDDVHAALAALPGDEPSGLVLEQYIADRPGHRGPFADYVSVEGLVSAGHISLIAVNGRFPTTAPFRETGFFIPAALPGDERAAVLELAEAAARAVGVSAGFFHTEIKMTPDGPCVIEVNGRIGGSVTQMLGRAAGVHTLPLAVRVALGEEVVFPAPVATDGVAFVLLVQPPATIRRVTAIEGLDAFKHVDGVQAVVVKRAPGEAVDWRLGTEEYVAALEGLVPDHDALAALEARLRREVVVRGE